MKEWFAIIMGASLLVLMVPILYRIIMGPTGFDRILGVNVIGTKTAVILVIIGTLFLAVAWYRGWRGDFTPNQHFGFEAAAWYWHFVDVVWLFLYVAIYWNIFQA